MESIMLAIVKPKIHNKPLLPM